MSPKSRDWTHFLIGAALVAVSIIFLFYDTKEGFQGPKILRNAELQPVIPFVPRKESKYGNTFKGVPLVIYHSWGTREVPPKMYEHIQKLIEQNPEFDYSFNSDEDCREFIAANFEPSVVAAFDCLKPGAFKSDLWRYCILYKKGGVYIDIKSQPKKKLITILETHTTPLFVKDLPKGPHYSYVWNGFMAAEAGNPVFRRCIDEIVKNVSEKNYSVGSSLGITGPGLIGKLLNEVSPNYTFEISNENHVIYDKDGSVLVTEYSDYRREQKQFQKTRHYYDLYKSRDVYQC